MALVRSPKIYICSEQFNSGEIGPILEQAGYSISPRAFDFGNGTAAVTSNLIVVDGSNNPGLALKYCQHLRLNQLEQFVPILFIAPDPSPSARLASLEHGADTYLLRPFDPQELLAQVRAFIRIKDRHDRLTEKTEEVNRINKRLQTAYQQIDQELELASRLQSSFLPQHLPSLPQVRFAVHYHPCGHVGGDFYDVFRLDETHIGFYVADVMGHGVPASLLTIFVKKGIRAKEIFGSEYRLASPSEVLNRLNHDLIDQQLSDQPFITMLYALLNVANGTIQFSRAGHPYPLHVPASTNPVFWHGEGTLLGVFETSFSNQDSVLAGGDKLLFYTDGVDHAHFKDFPLGIPSLQACASENRHLPIDDFIVALATELFPAKPAKDDLTLLGLEMLKPG